MRRFKEIIDPIFGIVMWLALMCFVIACCMGVLKIQNIITEITNERKAYIGVIEGKSEEEDIKAIYEHGAKVDPDFLESVKRDLGV